MFENLTFRFICHLCCNKWPSENRYWTYMALSMWIRIFFVVSFASFCTRQSSTKIKQLLQTINQYMVLKHQSRYFILYITFSLRPLLYFLLISIPCSKVFFAQMVWLLFLKGEVSMVFLSTSLCVCMQVRVWRKNFCFYKERMFCIRKRRRKYHPFFNSWYFT